MLKERGNQMKEFQMIKAKQQNTVALDYNPKHKISISEFVLL